VGWVVWSLSCVLRRQIGRGVFLEKFELQTLFGGLAYRLYFMDAFSAEV
jgi:hypothetical protein